MSGRTAIFAGTFDPVTNGHVDIIQRGAALFDRLVVLVARAGRDTLFDPDERVGLLRAVTGEIEGVEVVPFDGLLVDEARAHGATVFVRGVRGSHDWDYEMQMAFANRGLAPEIDTVFLPPSSNLTLVSGSLVREVASLGGDVSAWVPASVAQALTDRLAAR